MPSIVRGCGTRQKGGIYAECPLSPDGRPIEDFLVDPPRAIDPAALGVTPVGVKLVEVDGVTHVVDWVGSGFYENAADYVEEARRFGASRRLPRTLDFSRLTTRSRLLLIHARAHIPDHEAFYMATGWACPRDRDEHSALNGGRLNAIPSVMCAGLLWEDVVPSAGDDVDTDGGRRVQRRMPSFAYEARVTPPGLDGRRVPAVFMQLPIKNLAVIRDEGGAHEEALHAAEQSKLHVNLEDE